MLLFAKEAITMSKLKKYVSPTNEDKHLSRSSLFWVPMYDARSVGFIALMSGEADPDKYVDSLIANNKLEDEVKKMGSREFGVLVNQLVYAEINKLEADKELLVDKILKAFEWMKEEYEKEVNM